MCFTYELFAKKKAVEKHLDALFSVDYLKDEILVNGFSHPKMPILCNDDTNVILQEQWGLVPHWVKDETTAQKLAKMCLNARVETLHEKPSFRQSLVKRCIIPFSSFYEWRWEDEKGKRKTKYRIFHPNEQLIGFGGLYADWLNPNTAEVKRTYTMCTHEANEMMAFIHNRKKRMPLILTKNHYKDWLHKDNPVKEFVPISFELPIDNEEIKDQMTLF